MQVTQQQVALRVANGQPKPLFTRPRPLRLRLPVVTCRAGASHAGMGGHKLPSAWVAKCLERAQKSAVLLDGQHYIPLSEAQRWFEAGQHEGEAESSEQLKAALAERSRLQGEVERVAQVALREHSEHEIGMRRLLNYAMALEVQVEKTEQAVEEAVHEAAHETEEKLLLQYQQMLVEYEAAHEAETHAVEQGLRGQVKHLETMLQAAHEAKKQWREKALRSEEQFAQLRSLIQISMHQATEAAQWRHDQQAQQAQQASPAQQAQHGEPNRGGGGEQAPPPPHTNPRIRSTEAVASADADVAAAHPHASSARGEGSGQAKAKKKNPRKGANDPHSEPTVHTA